MDQYDACQVLTEIWRAATFFRHNSFDRRRVCSPAVWWSGNLSLTNWVGCGKLRVHERCAAARGLLLGVLFLLSSAACIIGLIIIIILIIIVSFM